MNVFSLKISYFATCIARVHWKRPDSHSGQDGEGQSEISLSYSEQEATGKGVYTQKYVPHEIVVRVKYVKHMEKILTHSKCYLGGGLLSWLLLLYCS